MHEVFLNMYKCMKNSECRASGVLEYNDYTDLPKADQPQMSLDQEQSPKKFRHQCSLHVLEYQEMFSDY